MNKVWFIVVVTIIIIVSGGILLLQNGTMPVSTDGKLKIAVSLPLVQNLVERLGGDQVVVSSIIKGSTCNHEYEPTASDMKTVADCTVFVKVGLGFDFWVDDLIAAATNGKTLVIDASAGVKGIKNDHDHEHVTENHHHEEAEIHDAAKHAGSEEEGHRRYDHHDLGNPHYWGDPGNVKIMAANIRDAFVKVRPDQKDLFTRNYEAFIAELDNLTTELRAKVDQLADKRIVSYSAAFPYFFTYFGFENLATVETTCEEEVSPKRMVETAELMRDQKIRVLVGEEVFPESPGNLARESKAKLVLLWPATDGSGDYLKTLQVNVEKMVSGLQ